jgi:hypothetical protein
MLKPCPVGASRQMHVGLVRPPPATARAETFMVLEPRLNTERKKVGMGFETSASIKPEEPE